MKPENAALVSAVAAALGFVPDAENSSWQARFTMPDGGHLYANDSRQHGKLCFSMGVPYPLNTHKPYYRNGDEPKTDIGVSETKDAAHIVQDIRRRLLPEYLRLLEDCKAAKARHDSAALCQREAAKLIAAALDIPSEVNEDGTAKLLYLNRGSVYANIQVDYDGKQVRFEHLHVSLKCAVDLAKVLAQHAVEAVEAETV